MLAFQFIPIALCLSFTLAAPLPSVAGDRAKHDPKPDTAKPIVASLKEIVELSGGVSIGAVSIGRPETSPSRWSRLVFIDSIEPSIY